MQDFAVCMECQKELGHPSFELFFSSYYDDRISYVECSRGHKSAHVIQSSKFEVLMESGANALIAGFTLEACASFSTALERLYEFALKVFITHKNINEDDYKNMFKEMSRQSERQLGAFMALYLTETGKPYKPKKDITEFRNAVIHKGQIPNPEEAKNFCSTVYESILEITDSLRNFSEALHKTIRSDVAERYKTLPPNLPCATSSGTIFFNMSSTQNKRTLSEALINFEEAKKKFEQSLPYLKTLNFFTRFFPKKNNTQN